MITVKPIAQGQLMSDGSSIIVFKLDNHRFAIGQSALYSYLTNGNILYASRYNLGISNLAKYLPVKMLNDPEFSVEMDLKTVRLFTPMECLSVCKGIILANLDGKINKKWSTAPRRAQLLLILFSEYGIENAIKKALKSNPLTAVGTFEQHLTRLLDFKS